MQILLLLKVTLLLVFAITEIYNNENLGHVMIYNYWSERIFKNNKKQQNHGFVGKVIVKKMSLTIWRDFGT